MMSIYRRLRKTWRRKWLDSQPSRTTRGAFPSLSSRTAFVLVRSNFLIGFSIVCMLTQHMHTFTYIQHDCYMYVALRIRETEPLKRRRKSAKRREKNGAVQRRKLKKGRRRRQSGKGHNNGPPSPFRSTMTTKRSDATPTRNPTPTEYIYRKKERKKDRKKDRERECVSECEWAWVWEEMEGWGVVRKSVINPPWFTVYASICN